MRWLFSIILIIIGAFLISLNIDQMGKFGHIVMRIIGVASFFVAGLIVKRKQIR